MYYIFNDQGDCTCSCDIVPSTEDIADRGEIAIESADHFDIMQIRLVDGQIQEKDNLPSNKEFETEDADSSVSNEIMDMAEIILDMSDTIKGIQKGGDNP